MVQDYCDSCESCIVGKARVGKPPGFLTPPALPKGPFFRVHADTIRSLPVASRLKHILVVVDSFTKFTFTHPLVGLTPMRILDGLTAIFSRFGAPSIFAADRGSEFLNRQVSAFLQLWGVTPHFTAGYNPQANGQAEAGVKIVTARIQTALWDAVKLTKKPYPWQTWPIYLPYITMAYNQTPNPVTHFSPYELVFGRVPPLPLSAEQLARQEEIKYNHSDHLICIQRALKQAHEVAEAQLSSRRVQMKRTFDRCRQPLRLKKGDFVYIYYPYSTKLRKLHPKAFGPFPVTKVSTLPGTCEAVGVAVQIGVTEAGDPVVKRFPRCRVRPVRAHHQDIDWSAYLARAEDLRLPLRESPVVTDSWVTLPDKECAEQVNTHNAGCIKEFLRQQGSIELQ